MTLLSANQIAYIFRANDKNMYAQTTHLIVHSPLLASYLHKNHIPIKYNAYILYTFRSLLS